MRTIRTTVAALVAVGVLSAGSAACTPQQTQGALNSIGGLITLILYAFAMGQSHPYTSTPTTAPPVTVATPVAS